MQRFVSLVILFCFYYGSVAASNCFPDYCQTATKVTPTPGVQCLLTKVQKGGDCAKLKFEDVNPDPPENVTAKFSLNAYVYEESNSKVTAFNFSVTDIDFYGLITRYQNLMNENQSACRHIWIYGNETYPAPKELYVSCPFSDIVYETLPYQLEYLVTGKGYKYSKQYIFNVPQHKHMEESIGVRKYVPFVYIDKTYQPHFSLHIQPLPEIYNVTQYRISWINNDTNSVIYTGLLPATSNHDISYNFTGHTGSFYFKISAVHPDCGEYGCANSTTPCIVIRKTSHRLLIMIISTVWIPPVILYVLYHLYKLYKKRVFVVSFQRREKPKCLLVYSRTRLSHLNVIIELAKYLRNCHVNVMLDILDCTDTTEKNWCDTAFQTANIVLIVISPPTKIPAVSAIYERNDNYLLRLVKGTMFENDKRYYEIFVPYSEYNDVDLDLAHLHRFRLPQELPKLVEAIHRMEYFRFFPNVPDKDFLDSIKLADLKIYEEDDVVNTVKEKLERGFVVSFQWREKPKCLLVYSRTRLSHLNVIIELAKYLRNCHINVMLDILDCTDTTEKNWCDTAFQTANIVLIVISPPTKIPAVSAIYERNDNYLLRLVKGTMFENDKRYYEIFVPYSEYNDVDLDLAHLHRFRLPQELRKLVEAIHRMEYFRFFPNVPDKDFLDSIKLADLKIYEEDDVVNTVKEKLERDVLENLLERRWNSWITALILTNTNVGSQSHAISIDRLNLLGESRESEQTLLCTPSTDHDNAFRIDQLNL